MKKIILKEDKKIKKNNLNRLKKIFKKEKKNIKEKNHNLEINDEDIISPAYINLKNPKFLEIDNIYYSGIFIANYNREQENILLQQLIQTNINMNISIFYEKQDSLKTIKKLTYNIGNVSTNIKSKNQNREDIDIAIYTYNDAKYIRKEIQVNNEDLYLLYIYIITYSENLKDLENNLNKIEGILISRGLIPRRSTFRQNQLFKSCLPLMENNEDIKNSAKRNILTSGLISTYPFISESIFDEKGIFIGKNLYNNSLIFLDRYNNNKYKNANMCIFGTSGAGKSFYTKLLIIRNRLIRYRSICYRSGKRV